MDMWSASQRRCFRGSKLRWIAQSLRMATCGFASLQAERRSSGSRALLFDCPRDSYAESLRILRKDCFGETPKPARETRALPMAGRIIRNDRIARILQNLDWVHRAGGPELRRRNAASR